MDNACSYKCGQLPDCAPLALAYVPMQQTTQPVYKQNDALTRGTLFPGLDLPFMNIVNKEKACNEPMCELMAIDFAVHELTLYLDTHPDDMEAFALLKTFLALSKEANRRYTEQYGPLTVSDVANCGTFTWLNAPWPWQYSGREG